MNCFKACKEVKGDGISTSYLHSLSSPLFKRFVTRVSDCTHPDKKNLTTRCYLKEGKEYDISRVEYDNRVIKQAVWEAVASENYYNAKDVEHLRLLVDFEKLLPEDKATLIRDAYFIRTHYYKMAVVPKDYVMEFKSPQEIVERVQEALKLQFDNNNFSENVKRKLESIKILIDKYNLLTLEDHGSFKIIPTTREKAEAFFKLFLLLIVWGFCEKWNLVYPETFVRCLFMFVVMYIVMKVPVRVTNFFES